MVILAALAGFAAGLGAVGAIWEGWVTDRLLQVRAIALDPPVEADFPVAVVGLDQASLTSKRLETIPRVFMSQAFAKAGRALFEAGATAIGLDFVFAFSADAFSDPQTGEARLRGYDRPFLQFLYDNRGRVFVARTSSGVPHRSITAAGGTDGIRSTEIVTDSDGVVRRHRPTAPLGQSGAFVDALLDKAGATIDRPYMPLPSARLGSVTPYLSLVDVLDMMTTPEGRAGLETFARGRVVLFGSTLANEDEHLYLDRFLPVRDAVGAVAGPAGRPPLRGATAGVYILADLIGAPMSGRIAIDVPFAVVIGLTLAFAVAGALAGLNLPLPSLPVVGILLVAAGLGLALAGLAGGRFLPPAAVPVAGLGALVVAGIAQVAVLKRRERELVRLFGHYLAPDVIRRMAEQERLSDLGGETRHVVVAFIDIIGFTKMSEKLADREVVSVVNACFGAIGAAITRDEGYIDKYIGDAIMAVWNAPNDVAEPEQQAVGCALKILALIPDLRRRTGQADLDLRIALNAGPALVGDIGGEIRRSFTVMGTTVNTASRIEAIAKDAGVRLAFSGPVAAALPPETRMVPLWQGRLRGLSAETTVLTLDDPRVWIDGAARALEAIEAEDFEDAIGSPGRSAGRAS
ncbi:CHASE2 domain family [Polymorphum gilvum SL003B-26A1]|uniref:CHASE2 domain family n=2 Tax=Polymorphum TaxID=991903 RepID=F2IWS4_POLGS|nr:CHASE2 domain family [Polymorphum gilvum SL003B-26A1]